jgi:(p)ppGpp synthase/HD superfamily hydrolase
MTTIAERYPELLAYIQQQHAGQVRAGNVPVWHHVVRVAELVDATLTQTDEANNAEYESIIKACLGHDLIEDTKYEQSELEAWFNPRDLEIIDGMTNAWGDANPAPYVKQVAAADEAVRLVKLADLYDNYASAAYTLTLLGSSWATNYFFPIVDPMLAALHKTKFTTYPQAAARLMDLANLAATTCHNELAHLRADQDN